MSNSIATLYHRMGFELPYSVWRRKGESDQLEEMMNPTKMDPLNLKSVRGEAIQTFFEDTEQKVQFTYADDYCIFLIFTEKRKVSENDLALLFDFFYK